MEKNAHPNTDLTRVFRHETSAFTPYALPLDYAVSHS